MGDIHLGKSPYNKKKGTVKVQIFFHVPNTGANNSYPGITPAKDSLGNDIPVSSAPGVTAQELIDLEAGDLCEVVISKRYALSLGVPAIKTVIRDLWTIVAAEKQTSLDNEYPFYGAELARS